MRSIPQAGFVRSLRPLLDMPLMAKAEPAKIAQLLEAYWQGIAEVLPEPFDAGNNPQRLRHPERAGHHRTASGAPPGHRSHSCEGSVTG